MDSCKGRIFTGARAAGQAVLGRARLCVIAGTLAATACGSVMAAEQRPPRWIASSYAAAVASFREGRFPEAYGRFMAIAEWGYAPAARHALWMCENGQELFGSAFDCAPHEIQGWAVLAGVDPAQALRRIHPALPAAVVAARLPR